jgi:hypothetical protein
MRITRVVWGCFAIVTFAAGTAVFADTIHGSSGAAFQAWNSSNLTQNGHPYWDNPSQDGYGKNVGFFMVNALTASLPDAPGSVPFWGNSYDSSRGGDDTNGTADLNFYFQRDEQFSVASLQLELAGQSNINAFGWYNIADPSVLHQIFSGPDSAPDTNTFSPSADYGFYLQAGNLGTYYTQSSLNPKGDQSHQHFVVFEQSAAAGAEVYWIGIEDQSLSQLGSNEGGYGDFNDMLVRITAEPPQTEDVPEPSAGLLALFGTLFVGGLLYRRRRE